MRKLYFSAGSPFARIVRIVLAEKGLDFEGEEAAFAGPVDQFATVNPNLQIPVFEEDSLRLFDTNLIVEYLLKTYPESPAKGETPALTKTLTRPDHHWEDGKILATLATLANAMVNLRQLGLSGIEAQGVAYLERQQRRIQFNLDWLEQRATPEGFAPGSFSLMDIHLLCHLEFSDARGGIFDWRGRPNLEAILAFHAARPSVESTAPGPYKPG